MSRLYGNHKDLSFRPLQNRDRSGTAAGTLTNNHPFDPTRGQSRLFHRSLGNQGMYRLVQAKFRIGQTNDKYEREADHMADRIVGQPVDGKKDEDILPAGAVPERTGTVVSSLIPDTGQALPPASRRFFAARLGHDFNNVRIHHGVRAAQAAQSIRARAFTLGNHVVFNQGEYSPHSDTGKRLLAHELTHVVQQRGAAGGATAGQNSPGFLQLQAQPEQGGSCPWEDDPESFSIRIAEYYVRDVFGIRGKVLTGSCTGSPSMCTLTLNTSRGRIQVGVSLAQVPHYVIATQIITGAGPRREYTYVCPDGGDPVFTPRQ